MMVDYANNEYEEQGNDSKISHKLPQFRFDHNKKKFGVNQSLFPYALWIIASSIWCLQYMLYYILIYLILNLADKSCSFL